MLEDDFAPAGQKLRRRDPRRFMRTGPGASVLGKASAKVCPTHKRACKSMQTGYLQVICNNSRNKSRAWILYI